MIDDYKSQNVRLLSILYYILTDYMIGLSFIRNSNFVLRQIAGESFLIPITTVGADLQRIYKLNESALEIWNCLEKEADIERLVGELNEKYDADIGTLEADIHSALEEFLKRGFLMQLDTVRT